MIMVNIDPANPATKTFFKSRRPLKKLTIISENVVKRIKIKINLTIHLFSYGINDLKTRSYIRSFKVT